MKADLECRSHLFGEKRYTGIDIYINTYMHIHIHILRININLTRLNILSTHTYTRTHVSITQHSAYETSRNQIDCMYHNL